MVKPRCKSKNSSTGLFNTTPLATNGLLTTRTLVLAYNRIDVL